MQNCITASVQLHSVELVGELALVSGGFILVNDAVSNSLVNLLDSCFVCFGSCGLVTGRDSSLILLYSSFERALEHLVLESFCFGNEYTFFGRFNVRQICTPPFTMMREIILQQLLIIPCFFE